MTMLPENLKAFQDRFENIAAATLSADQLVAEILVDSVIELKDITPSFYNILRQMEPFGPENPHPIFCLRNVKNTGTRIVKEEHVRFEVEQLGQRITGIGFGLADTFNKIESLEYLDIIFTLEENNFRDSVTLQMKVIDFDAAGKR
jgi:single-stranded-DNA-specific exonuclease